MWAQGGNGGVRVTTRAHGRRGAHAGDGVRAGAVGSELIPTSRA